MAARRIPARLLQEAVGRLRPLAQALPAATGVYRFLAADGATPLYIGKSVDVRARVLSHLRDRGNARLLCETHAFAHQATAGEVGALLLEAALIKECRPAWNRRLKRSWELCSLQVSDGVARIVQARDMDFSSAGGLHGLFRSRAAALERLRELADEWRLCLGVMGLERLQRGRRCFRAALGRCAGACHGGETRAAHAARLLEALASMSVRNWPWPGAVGLVEEGPAMRQVHVVRNWCYLGSVEREADAASLARVAPQFDVDGYRILCRPLLENAARLLRLD